MDDPVTMGVRVALAIGTAKIRRIERHYQQRPAEAEKEYALPSFRALSKPIREAARRFWSQRAWSEYAAVPALSQILLKGVQEKVPLGETSALTGILHDEALHTRLSQQAADALGGYLEDVPDDLAYDPYVYAAPTASTMIEALVTGGCLGETVSRALIQARVQRTTHPELRAIVARTLKDESVHVAFAWAVAERVVPTLTQPERRSLARSLEPALRGAGRSNRASTAAARSSQGKLRSMVADAGLGSCTPDEERAVVTRLFSSVLLPQLRRLAIPV